MSHHGCSWFSTQLSTSISLQRGNVSCWLLQTHFVWINDPWFRSEVPCFCAFYANHSSVSLSPPFKLQSQTHLNHFAPDTADNTANFSLYIQGTASQHWAVKVGRLSGPVYLPSRIPMRRVASRYRAQIYMSGKNTRSNPLTQPCLEKRHRWIYSFSLK